MYLPSTDFLGQGNTQFFIRSRGFHIEVLDSTQLIAIRQQNTQISTDSI
jgi:hypothetical protein